MGCFRLHWKFGELKPRLYSHQSAVHTPEIGIHWHLMGLCQNVMIFWHTREHHTGHLYCGKKGLREEKKQVVQIQIVVLNILYHYLVVLNVKIRIRFFGHLRALGTVRIS